MSEQSALRDAFRDYVARFDREIGSKDFGQHGTWERHFVKKLRFEEFVEKWQQFKSMESVYQGVLERGDTINDMMLHELRACAAELLIQI